MPPPNLSDLEPKELWAEFYHICTVPRGSGNLDGIRAALKQRAEQRGFRTVVEEASGNLLIVKEADAGYESKPCICLQGHMDMVCSKRSDNPHNFLKDPIRPRLEMVDGQLCMLAHGTTLGADNGIGVAAALALVFDKSFKSGRIEVLCTTDEETTMFGVRNLSPSLLTAKYLLNLDSEHIGAILVGSCGSFYGRFDFCKHIHPENACGAHKKVVISMKGLHGGHSGVNIHLQSGNAITLVARMLLHAAREDPHMRLCSLVGGTANNAIPMDCTAVLVCTQHTDKLLARLRDLDVCITTEHRSTDPNMSVAIEEVDCSSNCMCLSSSTTSKLIDFLAALPSGVERMGLGMIPMAESSVNLGLIRCDAESPSDSFLSFSARSTYNTYLEHLNDHFTSLSRMYDVGEYSGPIDGYSGWIPDLSSHLLQTCRKAWASVLRRPEQDAVVIAVHAGLECGEILKHYPHIQAVSIGPTISFPHSDRELCVVPTVSLFNRWLRETVTGLLSNGN